MKTFLVAIFMFILGFFVGGGIGINFSLNSGYDYMVSHLGNVSELPKNATTKMKLSFEQKKQEILKSFKTKKDEIISQIKNKIKTQLKAQIEQIFN